MTYPVPVQELIHCLTPRGHSASFYYFTCVSSVDLFTFVFLPCYMLVLLSLISPVFLIYLQLLTKVLALD